MARTVNIKDLINTLPQVGKVSWIGLRPGKREEIAQVEEVEVSLEEGLKGDHYHGRSKKRQVTLIQSEHLQAVATLLSKDHIDPALTRRNIVVSGINLWHFRISASKLEKLFWRLRVFAILVLEWRKTLVQVGTMQCAGTVELMLV